MEKICKTINNIEVRKTEESLANRTVEFVASDASRDAHGTVVNQSGWDLDRFNKNGVIGYQHNIYGDNLCMSPDPDDVIGKGTARVEDGQLILSVTFEPKEINEKAEKIYQKVLFGSLKAVSVGFIEKGKGHYGEGEEAKNKSQETYYFEGQELLEVSVVNIPANKNAVKRSLRDNAVMALNYIYKALDGKASFSDIEKMTVGEVLERIENRTADVDEHTDDPKEAEVSEEVEVPEAPAGEENREKGLNEHEIITIANAKLAL